VGCVDKKNNVQTTVFRFPFGIDASLGPWLLRNHRRRRFGRRCRGPCRCVCAVITKTTPTRVRNLSSLFIYLYFFFGLPTVILLCFYTRAYMGTKYNIRQLYTPNGTRVPLVIRIYLYVCVCVCVYCILYIQLGVLTRRRAQISYAHIQHSIIYIIYMRPMYV